MFELNFLSSFYKIILKCVYQIYLHLSALRRKFHTIRTQVRVKYQLRYLGGQVVMRVLVKVFGITHAYTPWQSSTEVPNPSRIIRYIRNLIEIYLVIQKYIITTVVFRQRENDNFLKKSSTCLQMCFYLTKVFVEEQNRVLSWEFHRNMKIHLEWPENEWSKIAQRGSS